MTRYMYWCTNCGKSFYEGSVPIHCTECGGDIDHDEDHSNDDILKEMFR